MKIKKTKQSLFIDSCAWNIFYSHNIDLSEEFPYDQYDLAMTKEVYSFEIASVPDELLKNYIQIQIDKAQIREDSFFGFSRYNEPADHKSRAGGFNEGRWMTYEEAIIVRKFEQPKNSQRPTGLYKNEADASLAIRALTGSIVLTAENLGKNGPLKKAIEEKGSIINIREFNPAKESLRTFVVRQIN